MGWAGLGVILSPTSTPITYLFKNSYKKTMIRNPNKVISCFVFRYSLGAQEFLVYEATALNPWNRPPNSRCSSCFASSSSCYSSSVKCCCFCRCQELTKGHIISQRLPDPARAVHENVAATLNTESSAVLAWRWCSLCFCVSGTSVAPFDIPASGLQ